MSTEVKTIGGRKWVFEDIKRIPKMPWKEQYESMQEDYNDLDWVHVTTDTITICYTSKKEGVA